MRILILRQTKGCNKVRTFYPDIGGKKGLKKKKKRPKWISLVYFRTSNEYPLSPKSHFSTSLVDTALDFINDVAMTTVIGRNDENSKSLCI